MEWYVYMLHCCDGTLYTGSTNRLEQRVLAHAQGRGAKYTRSRRPVELVYQETAADRSAALCREAQDQTIVPAGKVESNRRKEQTAWHRQCGGGTVKSRRNRLGRSWTDVIMQCWQ